MSYYLRTNKYKPIITDIAPATILPTALLSFCPKARVNCDSMLLNSVIPYVIRMIPKITRTIANIFFKFILDFFNLIQKYVLLQSN